MSEQEFLKSFGLRLRKIRRANDLTQAQVAKEIGSVSAGYICDIEKGRRTLPAYSVFLLEKLFDTRLMP